MVVRVTEEHMRRVFAFAEIFRRRGRAFACIGRIGFADSSIGGGFGRRSIMARGFTDIAVINDLAGFRL